MVTSLLARFPPFKPAGMSKRSKLRTKTASLSEAGRNEIEILENMVQFYIFWTNTEEIFLVSGLIFYVFSFLQKLCCCQVFLYSDGTLLKLKQNKVNITEIDHLAGVDAVDVCLFMWFLKSRSCLHEYLHFSQAKRFLSSVREHVIVQVAWVLAKETAFLCMPSSISHQLGKVFDISDHLNSC